MTAIFRTLTQHKLKVALLIGVILRVVLLGVFYESLFGYEITGRTHGSTAYDEYALNLLETGVYGREAGVPDANIPPLYSVIVAGLYVLFGRGGLQIGLMHTVFDVLTMLMLYQIVRRLFRAHPAHEWIATLSVLFFACYPYLIFQNLTLNDTAFFMLLMHAFILGMVTIRERPQLDRHLWLLVILTGMILGITTLNRALLPLLAIFCALWFLFRLSIGQTVIRLLPVALVSVLMLLPWMWRTYHVYEAFVPVALNTGENIYQGNNSATIQLFRAGYDVQWSPGPPQAIRGDYFRNNQILLDAGLQWITDHPDQLPELLWVKFLVHWSIDIAPRNNPLPGQRFELDENDQLMIVRVDDPDAQLQDIETIAIYSEGLFDRVGRPVHMLYFGGLLMLALVGVGLSARYWRDVSLLWFVQISMTIMYLIFHPSTRYRVPTDPLLFAFSAFTLVYLAYRWHQSKMMPPHP
ncbi:MAG: ArnT family glycosyltransferase [Anaerolineae bacterium]